MDHGLEGAAANHENGIKRETINGREYYTRVMYVASATSTWIDGYTTKVYSTDAPQGTIFVAENNSPLETVQENGATCYKVDTSNGRVTNLNSNGTEYYGAFKVCIPVDNVIDEGSFTIKATGGVAQYGLFLAYNPSATEQSYIISDPGYTTLDAQIPFSWSGTEESDTAKLQVVKAGAGGSPLEGAEFTLTGNRGTTVTGTTDRNGQIIWLDIPADEQYGKLSNGLYWTNAEGQIVLSGITGTVIATEVASIDGYAIDPKTQTQTIVVNPGDDTQHVYFYNDPISGVIIHKIDSVTKEGIYGVKFLVYDQNKNPIGEYTTDNRGYIYIDDLTVQGKGRLYIRELEAAQGYELDKKYKTVYVQPGKTIEIQWENTPITGQFQIRKYAAEYNEVTGTPAGTPLQGAVYEISEARSGKVVDYITTDARGVAASRPLPLGRYKIVEVTAPAYWQLSGTTFDETLEYSGQIIKLSDHDKPSDLGVSITKRGNAEVLAGSQMRYDITVANTPNVPLSDFYWHDRIPTDATRATVLTTGTYSARLNYRVLYKTNYTTAYQVLATNLLTTNSYSYSLNAIPMQAGEHITDIYFDFGKVPVGFQSISNPTLTVQVLGTIANNYQIVNRADVGGKYQGTWQTAQASWVTIVRKLTPPPTLPQTGY